MSDYSTLRVGVSADTSQVSREVRDAATEAGKAAADAIAKGYSSGFKNVQAQYQQLGKKFGPSTESMWRQTGRIAGNIINREWGQAAANGVKLMGSAITKGASGLGKAFAGTYSAIGKGLAQAGTLLGQATLKTADLTAKALGAATLAATAFGVAAFRTAARVGEMDATLRALAKGDQAVYTSMQKTVGEVRHQGIEAGVAQNLVAQFTRSELDLSKATDLATVAQNAAVIAGRNSTEVLDDLVHGVMTQNSEVLRNAGINVQAGKAMSDYAASVGKSAKDLTDAERAQAVLNAVIAAGKPIAGAYASAMEEPGKVLRSFPRIIDDIKVSVGQGLVEAFGPMILRAYELAKALSASLAPGGSLRPLLDGIMAAVKNLAQPLAGVVERFTAFVKNVKPGAFTGILDALKKFAPLIASAGTGLATFAGGGVLQNIPVLGKVLGNLGGPLGAVVSGVGMLIATSPDLRKQFAGLLTGLKPVFSAFMGLAAGLAGQLVPVVRMLLPVIAGLVESFAPLITTVFQVAGTLVKALLPAIKPLLPVIEEMAFILSETLQGALMELTPAFVMVAKMIGFVIRAVAPLLPPLMALVGILIDLAVKAALPLIPPLVQLVQAILPLLVELCTTLLVPTMALLEALIPIVTFAARVAAVLIGLATKALVPLITWITEAVKWIVGGSPGLIPAFQTLAAVVTTVMGVVRAVVVGYFTTIKNVIVAVMGAVSGIVTAAWNAIRDITVAALGVVKAVVSGAFAAVQATIGAVTGAITRITRFGWEGIKGIVRDALADLRRVIQAGFDQARQIITGAVGAIRDTVNRLTGFFRQAATDAINALKAAITNTLGNVAGFCERTIVGPLRNGVRTIVGFFATAGADAIHGLFNGIKNALGNVKNWVTNNIFNPIKKAIVDTFKLGSPSKVMEDMGRNVMAGFVKGVLVGAPVKLAKTLFGSLPEALGAFVSKGFLAIADLPAKAISALGGLASSAGKAIAGAIGGLFGLTGKNLTPGGGGAVNRWRPLMAQVLAGFGRMDLMENFMRQLASESGGNPKAINLWDSNAKKGIPSKGLMQVIDPTFAAYAGPFKSRGIWDPLANIFAGVAYALKRYGARVAAVIGHGHGYALGGIISEPVVGFGRSGDLYRFGERGAEVVTPLRGGLGGSGYNPGPLGRFGRAGGVTVNVYPQPGQSELDIAAAVQRRLAWAEAAGAA